MASTQDIVFDVLKSGGFSTTHSNASDWVNYINSVGLEAGLRELNRVMPQTNATLVNSYISQPQQQQQQQPQQQQIQQQPQYTEAEARKMIETAMQSGNYNTSKLDEWTDYAMREGVEKALTEFQKNNPGTGNYVTNISKDLGKVSAERILSQTPNVQTSNASVIPSLNLANLYQPANFQPQVQQPFYPTQESVGLRAALQTPTLVDMPTVQPTLTPQTAYIGATQPVATEATPMRMGGIVGYQSGGAVPTSPPSMRAGGVVGYQEGGRVPLPPPSMRAGGVVGYQEGGMPQYSPEEVGSTFDISEYLDPETGRFYVNEFQRDVVFNPALREAERMAGRLTPEEEMSNYEQMLGRLRVPGTYRTPRNMAEGGLASVAQQVAAEGRRGDSTLVHMTNDEVEGLQSLANLMGGSLTVNPETGLPEANFFKKILPIVAAIAAPYLGPGLTGAAIAGGLAATGTVIGGGSLDQGIKTGLTAFGSAGLTSGAMGADPLGATTGESTFSIANTFGGAKNG
jgi:hypothetical protein